MSGVVTEQRLTVFEWAKRYVGDPDSWQTRGELALKFLIEEGLERESLVLEIGCGCLSAGAPLIRWLEPGCYVGIEPNGWLVEAALAEMADLEERMPRFLWRSDFDASSEGRQFDFVFAHSVLSHAAYWQLQMFLAATASSLRRGGVALASYRLADEDSGADDWTYPDNTFFSWPSIQAAAWSCKLSAEQRPELRERMIEVAPADCHDWARFVRR